MKPTWRAWLVDVLVGGLTGAIVGGIVAVNLVLYYGVEQGYETDLGEIFGVSALLGVVVVGVLAAGPVVGVLIAHMQRIKRSHNGQPLH